MPQFGQNEFYNKGNNHIAIALFHAIEVMCCKFNKFLIRS